MLRGRKTVRAQSTILYKKQTQVVVDFIHNRVFGTDALFIRTKNRVGARSAQWSPADSGRRWRILRAVTLALARTATRPRGLPIARG
jgi:hypothetical protein